LIGVTTAIKSPTGVSAGIGFAVPVDTVQRVVPQLISTGKVKRPWLGIGLLSDRASARLVERGLVIHQVYAGSAAEKAGLRSIDRERQVVGDVIIAIDGHEVETQTDLYRGLDRHDVGESVRLTVLRDNKPIDVEVTLQEGPKTTP
jgi:S1-C subfamily serine protease